MGLLIADCLIRARSFACPWQTTLFVCVRCADIATVDEVVVLVRWMAWINAWQRRHNGPTSSRADSPCEWQQEGMLLVGCLISAPLTLDIFRLVREVYKRNSLIRAAHKEPEISEPNACRRFLYAYPCEHPSVVDPNPYPFSASDATPVLPHSVYYPRDSNAVVART
ncbi:GL12313 [Drosophila persimilis]|uniref:GL12313 n=1 Tax=Drosophila persimilis TaxID=7234 RepID=B4GM61_DROPE|nr:GL12313 [Drosophila persimilis]